MFSLTLLSSLLTDFLQNDLPCLAATGSVDAQYRLSSVCRSCEYESDCRTRTLEEDTLSKIPYLAESTHAAALHTLGNQNSFARLVLEVLDAVPPGVVEAYQTQSPVLIPDARSRLIPISEDVCLSHSGRRSVSQAGLRLVHPRVLHILPGPGCHLQSPPV